jgi:RNA polymerase sigma factor (sigma-70 family)
MASAAPEISALARNQAFETLYRRYVADVYHYALALLRNPADAEDVTQTTFLNAYRAYQSGVRVEKPQNWLIKITHNVARSRHARSSRRVREVPLEDHVEQLAVPEEERPNVEALLEALGRLPFNQRAALVMRELEGRSYADIAETIGVSVSAVETLIFRARRTMRTKASAVRTLAAIPLPSSLSQLFGSGGLVAGGGAAAGGGGLLGVGLIVKTAVALVAGLVTAGVVTSRSTHADAVHQTPAPVGSAAVQSSTEAGSRSQTRSQTASRAVEAGPKTAATPLSAVATAEAQREGSGQPMAVGPAAGGPTQQQQSAAATASTTTTQVAAVVSTVSTLVSTATAAVPTVPVQVPAVPTLPVTVPTLPVTVPAPPPVPTLP